MILQDRVINNTKIKEFIPDAIGRKVVIFYCHGLGACNKWAKEGPLYFALNPGCGFNVDFPVINIYNSDDIYRLDELWDVLNYINTNWVGYKIIIVGHSMGGRALDLVLSSTMYSCITGATRVSGVRALEKYYEYAVTNRPAFVCHALDDTVTKCADSKELVDKVNAEVQKMWMPVIANDLYAKKWWSGTSHATANKVFKDKDWQNWFYKFTA